MFKRFFLALALSAGLLGPAYAAGTIPGISMTQQLDASARPLSGGLLYLIAAGTTSTPQNCYHDTDLTIAWPNPITLDSAGRVPQLICADGSIKVRLTDRNGVQQLVQDNILIIGASSGSGGGGTVDATTVLATGDVKSRYGTGTLAGFVRLNGRTIGSATSGATERANADTQALFEYLWGADANLAVSGGRGASANADWTANKTLKLPDGRGRVLAGLDDMGNSDATRLAFSFGSSNKTLGAVTVLDYEYLTQGMLPAVAPTFTGNTDAVSVVSSQTNIPMDAANSNSTNVAGGSNASYARLAGPSGHIASQITSSGTFQPRGTISALGSGLPHSTVQPTLLVTTYIKL